MASDTLAELLGVDPGTPRPNAYQLFGLRDGESDPQVITAAIDATLRRLKAAEESSDPKAWKQAAAAVTKARKILTNADAKAAYDAKRSRRPRGEAIDDPLQGLLPQYDPLAAFDLTAAAERAGTLRPPQPTVPDTSSAKPAVVTAVNASQASRPVGRRRRHRFPWAAVVMTLMVLGMLGGIGVGIHLLTDRERRTAEADAAAAPEAMPELPQVPIDSVLGSIAEEKKAGSENFLSADEIERSRKQAADNNPPTPEPSDAMTADVSIPAPAAGPDPVKTTPPKQSNEAARQAGQAAIDAAEQAILENNWTEMKRLAAEAVQIAADDDQKSLAQRYFQLADLADYYYIGLMQSLEKLEAGDQMELENIGTVGVVEANETTFAIQVNNRPKSFEFDKIPFFVVDAIAKQSMDLSDPTTQAAKAIHQAISVNATPEHRRQSLGWLAELPDTLQGAEPGELQQAIRELYPNL
ncbi:MAG: hypothetical protein WD119_00570 [Pirellulaceae bacterium]